MIPLPQIIAELIMAVGAALLGASVFALVKPKRAPDGEEVRATARGRLIINAFIGAVVLVWGFASFITKNGV